MYTAFSKSFGVQENHPSYYNIRKEKEVVGSLTKPRNCIFFQKSFFSHGAIQNIQIQLVTKPCRLCPMGS